jgi:hypothetical protein
VAAFRRSAGPTVTAAQPPVESSVAPAVATSPIDGAVRILAERLARGEIDPDEYRLRLETLRNTSFGAEVTESGT